MSKTEIGTTQKLAEEIKVQEFHDLPRAAVERVKCAILDDIGIAFMGYEMGGRPLIEYAKEVGGVPESSIIGDGLKVHCGLAAGINAQMAYDTDFNETGPGHHALSSIAQTGIALSERQGLSGKELITAIAISYELNGRFHRSLKKGHTTETKNHLAACNAICAVKLLDLDVPQVINAMGIATWFAPATSERLRKNNWWKRIGMGNFWFCQLGVKAALLALNDFKGPSDFVERDQIYNEEKLLESPAPYYYLINELHIKPWVASRGCHGGIEMVVNTLQEEGIAPEEIQKIIFKDRAWYLDFPFNNPAPKEYWDAIYSVQWATAMAILGYDPGPEWFTSDKFNDPKCLNLAKKVVLEEDPVASELWETDRFAAKEPNTVEMIAKGNIYRKQTSREFWLGSPRRPMPDDMVEDKFIRLASRVIGSKQARELLDILKNLEAVHDIKEITGLFSPV